MAGFGKGTDYFDIPTSIGNTDLHLISGGKTPKPKSMEYVRDEEGDIVDSGSYEGGPADAVECVYELQGGTLDCDDLALGPIDNGATKLCITGIDIETSNTNWPKVTVSGFTGVTGSDDMPNFTLPTITINGKKIAQEFDFTITDGTLVSTKLSVKGDMAHTLDEDGVVGAMAFNGCTANASMSAVESGAAAVTWTKGTDWTETQAPTASNTNIGWGESTASQEMQIDKDSVP
jgi:hypothetical protein